MKSLAKFIGVSIILSSVACKQNSSSDTKSFVGLEADIDAGKPEELSIKFIKNSAVKPGARFHPVTAKACLIISANKSQSSPPFKRQKIIHLSLKDF